MSQNRQLAPQTIRETTAIQLCKNSGKRLVYATGSDDMWNVVNLKTGACLPTRTFRGACYVAWQWDSIVAEFDMENHAKDVLTKTIRETNYVN